MAEKSLKWEDVAGGVSDGTIVNTGGIAVTVGFEAESGAGATIGTEDTDQYVAPGEDFDDDSSLALYGHPDNSGPGDTSTTTLAFGSTDSAYADTVTDVSFRINDLDRGNPSDKHIDIVTVTAFDADGNEVDVDFTPEGQQIVDGNTVTGANRDDGDQGPDDQVGSVLVNIAGPVAEIRIDYENDEQTDQKIWLTDVHFQTMEASDPDGYVEGTNNADLIDVAYTGDPDGDKIDNGDAVLPGEGPDDDIVLAGDGNDVVRSGLGDDEVYAGGGSDSVEGGTGNDVIYGDGDLDGVGGSDETARESFNWSELDDPDRGGRGRIDDGDDLDGMTLTQDTGNVTVTATIESDDTARTDSEFDTQHINVDGIDGGDESVNDRSSLRSYDNNGNGDATYGFDFSEPVTNAQFTVSDIDGNLGQVSVRAYAENGDQIPVALTAGDDLTLSDNDSVAGDETATGTANGPPTDGDNAMLVDIAGPVSRIEVDHVNVGDGSSQVNISDIFFDAPVGDDLGGGDAGDDTLSGGEGDDSILGQGGDDLIDGGAGNDTVEGGTGDDTISGDAPVTPVSITIDDTNAGFTNQVFAYTIDPDSGAVSNIQTLSTDAEDDKGKTFTYDAAPGAQVGVGIVSPQGTFHSSGYGANVGLNSDGLEHTQGRGQGPDGQVTLGFEDLDRTPGNKPDDDFDDVVVTIDLGTSGASLDNAHYTYGSQTPETADDGDDSLHGGTGDDLIYGLGGNDTITGGDGGDTVHGGSGNDDIDTSGPDPLPDLGYPGLFPADGDTENDRDSVTGGAGNDTITTGDDKDTISGGTGNDSINAGLDDDDVSGGADDDTIVAGEGSDTVTGGTGDDLIYGGLAPGFPDSLNIRDDNPDGPDDLVPDNGRDLIDGGDGDDTIFGQDDDDTIFGGAGDDSIDAGIDDDLVFGGSGDDIVTGGQGADTLSGGDDRDTFLGATVGDDIDGGSGGDDYDTLDLTGSAPVGGSLNVIYDSNPENGTVEFFDDNGLLLGSAAFEEIENVIPCFTPGSLIATPKGERPVEELQVGDRVITRDNGLQEIRWIGAKTIKGVEMARNPALKPVLVRRGALGNGLPERDMTLSPNHRVLIANERAALYFDEREVLAAAKHLVGMDGIHEVDAMATTYIHFMFDHHEVVLSDGAWTESFQPGDMSLRGIGDDQRSEIYALFPELESEAGIRDYRAARRSLKKHEAQLLVK